MRLCVRQGKRVWAASGSELAMPEARFRMADAMLRTTAASGLRRTFLNCGLVRKASRSNTSAPRSTLGKLGARAPPA